MLTNNLDMKETTLKGSVQSHLIAFAAEKSRLEKGKLIKISK